MSDIVINSVIALPSRLLPLSVEKAASSAVSDTCANFIVKMSIHAVWNVPLLFTCGMQIDADCRIQGFVSFVMISGMAKAPSSADYQRLCALLRLIIRFFWLIGRSSTPWLGMQSRLLIVPGFQSNPNKLHNRHHQIAKHTQWKPKFKRTDLQLGPMDGIFKP